VGWGGEGGVGETAPEVAVAEARGWWEGRSSAGVECEGCRVAGSWCS